MSMPYRNSGRVVQRPRCGARCPPVHRTGSAYGPQRRTARSPSWLALADGSGRTEPPSTASSGVYRPTAADEPADHRGRRHRQTTPCQHPPSAPSGRRPPSRPPTPPSTPSTISAAPATARMRTGAGASAMASSGSTTPTAKLDADTTAACTGSAALGQPDSRGPFHAVGRPPRSARSLIPRSIRWVITKATTSNRLDEERRPPLGVRVALAHQQPGRPVRPLPHDKGPGAVVGGRHRAHRHATAQHQRSALLHNRDAQPNLRGELDLVPDLEVLPLGDDPVGAVEVAADQVPARRSCKSRPAPARAGRSRARPGLPWRER